MFSIAKFFVAIDQGNYYYFTWNLRHRLHFSLCCYELRSSIYDFLKKWPMFSSLPNPSPPHPPSPPSKISRQPYHPLPGGCQKFMVPLHILLLYTIISTTSKRKTTDLVGYLNYVPSKTEKHFRLSLEMRADLVKGNIVKSQYCKK